MRRLRLSLASVRPVSVAPKARPAPPHPGAHPEQRGGLGSCRRAGRCPSSHYQVLYSAVFCAMGTLHSWYELLEAAPARPRRAQPDTRQRAATCRLPRRPTRSDAGRGADQLGWRTATLPRLRPEGAARPLAAPQRHPRLGHPCSGGARLARPRGRGVAAHAPRARRCGRLGGVRVGGARDHRDQPDGGAAARLDGAQPGERRMPHPAPSERCRARISSMSSAAPAPSRSCC